METKIYMLYSRFLPNFLFYINFMSKFAVK